MSILKVWDGTQFVAIGGPGVGGSDTQLQFNSQNLLSGLSTLTFNTGSLVFSGNYQINSAGGGYQLKEGTNATMGTGVLSGGTATVSTSKVTANSRIFLSDQGGSITNIGSIYISAKTGGVSFTVASTNVLDASTFAWIIFEPA